MVISVFPWGHLAWHPFPIPLSSLCSSSQNEVLRAKARWARGQGAPSKTGERGHGGPSIGRPELVPTCSWRLASPQAQGPFSWEGAHKSPQVTEKWSWRIHEPRRKVRDHRSRCFMPVTTKAWDIPKSRGHSTVRRWRLDCLLWFVCL